MRFLIFWAGAIGLILSTTGCIKNTNLRGKSKNNEAPSQADPVGDEAAEKGGCSEEPKVFEAKSDVDFLHSLPQGEEQIQTVCARNEGKTNKVINAFCVDGARPTSLIGLQQALGIAIVDPTQTGRGNNGAGDNPSFAVQGHSSSLVGRFVSALNPRVVVFSDEVLNNNTPNPDFVIQAFTRGDQLAEIIVNNPDTSVPDFFLVSFENPCNSTPEGCTPYDLLTPEIEQNWSKFTLYDEDDLKNTIVDCQHCHQPQGPGTVKFARMQELRNPWTHWFRDNTDGQSLTDDYYAAHGQNETYGGIPGPMIEGSDPQLLENLVRGNGFDQDQVQEVEFPTATIRNEVNGNNNAQPEDNTVPGVSPTWESLYTATMDLISDDNRNVIPIPYHDVKVTEPSLLTKFTEQYQGYLNGTVTRDTFENHLYIFKEDKKEQADMGFALRDGIAAQQALNMACRQCHNSQLNQDITRAKFNVDLASMPVEDKAAEIDKAIDRLKLGYSPERRKQEGFCFVDKGSGEEVEDMERYSQFETMPPKNFKQLTDSEIDMIVGYLEAEKASL